MELEELDNNTYSAFWLEMQQLRFEIDFFDTHFSYCVFMSRLIKFIIIGITTLATVVWMQFEQAETLKNVCIWIILISQALSAVSENFPYEKRKSELHDLSHELEHVFAEIEAEWRKVQSLEYNNQEINDMILNYKKRIIDIESHYLKDDDLPEYEFLYSKADIKAERYFTLYHREEE